MAFDQSPQLLGVASDATARTQEVAQKKQALTQEAIQNANAPIADIAKDVTEKQLDKITITPEMANGIAKLTGDDGWSRTAGTKWDPRIFTAMVGLQSKKAYQQDIISGKEDIEKLKDQAAQYKQDQEDKAKADRQAAEDKAKKDREDTANKAKKERQDAEDKAKKSLKSTPSTKGGTAEAPQDKEFIKTYRQYGNDLKGFNSVLLSQMAKTDPTKAKELQDKQMFLQQNKQRFDKLQGVGDENSVITITDSTGQTHQIYKKNLEEAQKRDASVKVVANP
jgi:hypothetical protein